MHPEPQLVEQAAILRISSWASRKREQYRETRTDMDVRIVKYLIDALLPGRDVALPRG